MKQLLQELRETWQNYQESLTQITQRSQEYQAKLALLYQQAQDAASQLDSTTNDQLRTQLETYQQDAEYKQMLALTLANAAYDVLLVVDPQRRVIGINHAGETLFNHPQPLGQALKDVVGTDALDLMVDDAIANEEESYEDQIIIRERNYRVRAQVIRQQSKTVISIALQDVTELVRLNRARRDMVANISHELRHPIANIRLTIDGLFHDQDKPKRKDSISSLRAIARETDTLLWLVQELYDLSVIESGQAIMRMTPNSALEIANEAVERLREQATDKNVTVQTLIPAEYQVLVDRDQVRRVLINLVHNAIKWTPKGGKIDLYAEGSGEEVTLIVTDSGPGVPDDQRTRIFERFYQIDTARSGKDGTGLGLAICKHIVEAHGGQIWAEGKSKRNGGYFAFTLLNALSTGGG
jgi:two-component system, OmpR family, phosphate regulon sensor histidine kinase PhoR